MWSSGPILPTSLIDLLEMIEEIKGEEEDAEQEIDYEELLDDD